MIVGDGMIGFTLSYAGEGARSRHLHGVGRNSYPVVTTIDEAYWSPREGKKG